MTTRQKNTILSITTKHWTIGKERKEKTPSGNQNRVLSQQKIKLQLKRKKTKFPPWNKVCLIQERKQTNRKPHIPLFFIDLVAKSHCIHNSQFQANITFLEFVCLSSKSNAWTKVWGFKLFKISIEQCVNQCGLSNSSLPWKKQSTCSQVQSHWEQSHI